MRETSVWRTIARGCGVLAVTCILAGMSACHTSPYPTTQQSTATALAPTPAVETRLRALLKGRSYGAVVNVTWDASQRRATVDDALGNHTSLSSLPKIDIYQIEQVIWTSQIHPLEVDVIVTGNQVDTHDVKHNVKLGEAHLTASRAAKFRWDTLNWRSAWNDNLYDYQWVDERFYQRQSRVSPLSSDA